jgi:putative flippase GtrA
MMARATGGIVMAGRIGELVLRLRDIRFLRYVAASVGALAVDFGSFLALMSLGLAATPASSVGYAAGILAHWVMSSRTVFADTVAERGSGRNRQKALFVGSALAGLAITTAIVGSGEIAGIDARISKLCAVVVSFLVTYWLRKSVVFR